MINKILLVLFSFSFMPVSYAMEKNNPIQESSKEDICQKIEKALIAHIKNNDIEKFKELLGYVDKNYYSTKILSIYEFKSTLLTIAVMYNRHQIAEVLVENGAKVSGEDISMCYDGEYSDLLDFLMKNLDHEYTKNNYQPLILKFAKKEEHFYEIFKILKTDINKTENLKQLIVNYFVLTHKEHQERKKMIENALKRSEIFENLQNNNIINNNKTKEFEKKPGKIDFFAGEKIKTSQYIEIKNNEAENSQQILMTSPDKLIEQFNKLNKYLIENKIIRNKNSIIIKYEDNIIHINFPSDNKHSNTLISLILPIIKREQDLLVAKLTGKTVVTIKIINNNISYDQLYNRFKEKIDPYINRQQNLSKTINYEKQPETISSEKYYTKPKKNGFVRASQQSSWSNYEIKEKKPVIKKPNNHKTAHQSKKSAKTKKVNLLISKTKEEPKEKRNQKTINLFDDNKLLSNEHKFVDPTLYPSQFIVEEPDSINQDSLENITLIESRNFPDLLAVYYALLEPKFSSENREIFSHGIMAIDFSQIKNNNNYVEITVKNLLNINNQIIPEANQIYGEFVICYQKYLDINIVERIKQVKSILLLLKNNHEIISNNDNAMRGALFILGEHFARVLEYDKYALNDLLLDVSLLNEIKNLRNAIKHGEDNIVITDNFVFVIGIEPISHIHKLFERLISSII